MFLFETARNIPCSTQFLREFNLRMGGFLRFAETYFCDWNLFFRLSESRLLFGIITFSFYDYKQSIANAGEHGLLGEQYAEV